MEIKTFILGPLETNTYLLCEGDACWVVDPAAGIEEVIQYCKKFSLRPSAMLITHGHGDHIAGAAKLKEQYKGIRLICPRGDAPMLTDAMKNFSGVFGFAVTAPPADELISPGWTFSLGDAEWVALDTSGHSSGGMSYYCQKAGIVLSGDALFAGSIGRTDMPGASTPQLIKNIRDNLLTLPEKTRVLPGHGGETTISREKLTNPFLAGL